MEIDPTKLTAEAKRVREEPEEEHLHHAAAVLLEELGKTREVSEALASTFARLMVPISDSYFGRAWADEHQFCLYARLVEDHRAWGYGSDEEMKPLRWLREVTGCWYDGEKIRKLDEWELEYDGWAEGQAALVRRIRPGALRPDQFPPPEN
ncbi:MAG TPA: hypothetical protein QGF35_02320 [Dehalococcoidia bacterium]|nr:hypothetical protein [Dehalococcoidia bacterium]